MRTLRHKQFVKQIKKLSAPLRRQVMERLLLHSKEPRHPLLNDHELNPPWAGYQSINVTGDYRLIYEKLDAQTYFLRAIGTHHQLFGS